MGGKCSPITVEPECTLNRCKNDAILQLCNQGIIEEFDCSAAGKICDDGACVDAVPEPYCGNGVIERESGEQCDDNDFGGKTCASMLGSWYTGTLNCNDCQIDTSAYTLKAGCGNGKLDSGEYCEGTNLNGATCASLLGSWFAGTLKCNSCYYDTSGCWLKPGCGNGVLEGSEECDDGNLSNGDGCSSTCQQETDGYCMYDEGIALPSGSVFCDSSKLFTCMDGEFIVEECPFGCSADNTTCGVPICFDGETRCDGTILSICHDGLWAEMIDCKDEAKFCDSDSGACVYGSVECEADSDCGPGQYCASGECVEGCTSDSDCLEGYYCEMAVCVAQSVCPEHGFLAEDGTECLCEPGYMWVDSDGTTECQAVLGFLPTNAADWDYYQDFEGVPKLIGSSTLFEDAGISWNIAGGVIDTGYYRTYITGQAVRQRGYGYGMGTPSEIIANGITHGIDKIAFDFSGWKTESGNIILEITDNSETTLVCVPFDGEAYSSYEFIVHSSTVTSVAIRPDEANGQARHYIDNVRWINYDALRPAMTHSAEIVCFVIKNTDNPYASMLNTLQCEQIIVDGFYQRGNDCVAMLIGIQTDTDVLSNSLEIAHCIMGTRGSVDFRGQNVRVPGEYADSSGVPKRNRDIRRTKPPTMGR